jgi:ubiquinone/menaquinone biosynthesis C-methylase UbiE
MTHSDEWDSDYESGEFEHWEYNYPSPELVALVACRFFDENDVILDVGCGGGWDAIFLAGCGYKVIGLDFSAAALRIAKKRAAAALVEVDWRIGNVFEMPIEDDSVDVVTDRGLFHVIEDVDRPKYTAEIFRVLKRRGRAVIRGASTEPSEGRFNPITDEAIDEYFSPLKFNRGPLLRIPLLSVAGVLDARMVVLEKIAKG